MAWWREGGSEMTPTQVHEALHRAADDRHGTPAGDLLREVGRTLGVALELVAEARMALRTGGGEDLALRYLERVQAPSWSLRQRTSEVVGADVAELLREGLRAAGCVFEAAREARLALREGAAACYSFGEGRVTGFEAAARFLSSAGTMPAAVFGVRGAL